MNKNELELEKIRLHTERFHSVMETIAKIATIVGWAFAVWVIIEGLKIIVLAKPEAIQALAKVVESMQLNAVLGWIGAVLASGAWWFERKGKKRAYRTSSDLRKKLESQDPHRQTSGLDDNGHTPK